jgi:type III secretion system FlhB-like substrate exporter
MPKDLTDKDSKNLAIELLKKVKDKGIVITEMASLISKMNEIGFLYTVPINVFVEIARLLEEDGKEILN